MSKREQLLKRLKAIKRGKKIIFEHIDADYLQELPDDELEWYIDFVEVHYGARFKDGNQVAEKYDEEDRKKVYGANNARNRDISNFTNKRVDDFDPAALGRSESPETVYEILEDINEND